MSTNASRVFAAWTQLTQVERSEVISLINKYQAAATREKERISLEHLNESHRSFEKGASMNFGPAPGACPTCGR